MKIISQHDFEAKAWEILYILQDRKCQCGTCETVYMPETMDDITIRGNTTLQASCDCPVCGANFGLLTDQMTLLTIQRLQTKGK